MSSFEFLDSDAARAEDGFEPLQRSPLRRALRDAPPEVRDISRDVPDELGKGLAGIQVPGERLLRRLTDLDLDELPATGMVAHVRATVLRDGENFRIFFPQEYADHMAEVVLDAIEGLA